MICNVPKDASQRQSKWGLCSTNLGDPYITFDLHVRHQKTANDSSLIGDLSRFNRLPEELRIHIISLCDAPTLFQLMHTSSALRTEASKWFWDDQEVWYKIDGRWLLGGGFTSHIHYAPDFLARAQRIEIDFVDPKDMSKYFHDGMPKLILANGKAGRDRGAVFRRFWQTFTRVAPSATHVVLGLSQQYWPHENMMELQRAMADMCPAGINIRASVLWAKNLPVEPFVVVKRLLWQRAPPPPQDSKRTPGTVSTWDIVDGHWTRTSVMPPPKTFQGTLGEFSRLTYLGDIFTDRKTAVNLLVHAALERHHSDNRGDKLTPSTCLSSGCLARMEETKMMEQRMQTYDDWTVHVLSTNQYNDIHLPDAVLPPAMKETFEKYFLNLCREHKSRVEDPLRRLSLLWGDDPNDPLRVQIEDAVLDQIDKDPLYAAQVPAGESQLWRNYCR